MLCTAEVRVAVGGFYFDNPLTHFKDRNVEGAAAEVINRDGFILLLVESIKLGGGRRFVDDALDVRPAIFYHASLVAWR